MTAPQRSHPDSLRSLRPARSASPAARAERIDSSVDDSPKNPLMRGLRDIFGRFAGRPDFSALYESDLERRLYKPWVRVGNSMRLALGQPTTLITTHPDGTRTAHVIGPDTSGKEYPDAVRRAKETMQKPDDDLPASQVVIMATREEATRLVALFGRSTGNVSERR